MPGLEPDESVPDEFVPDELVQPIIPTLQEGETQDIGQGLGEDSSSITLPDEGDATETFTDVEVVDAVLPDVQIIVEGEVDVAAIFDELGFVGDEVLSSEDVDAILEADLTGSELEAVLDAVFDGDLSDAETLEVAEELLSQPLSDDEFVTVLDAIFDEVVSDEVLVAVFETVLATELSVERFADLVNVLEVSDAISSEQVAEVVTLVLAQDGGVTDSQATELASSPKVLESIDGEQAAEVFDAIVGDDLSLEQGALIVEALLEASTDVKGAFEGEINVFTGVFDEYVPLGSLVDVGTRRAIVAGVSAVFVASAAPAVGGSRRVQT
jgi:hypothetical protein